MVDTAAYRSSPQKLDISSNISKSYKIEKAFYKAMTIKRFKPEAPKIMFHS